MDAASHSCWRLDDRRQTKRPDRDELMPLRQSEGERREKKGDSGKGREGREGREGGEATQTNHNWTHESRPRTTTNTQHHCSFFCRTFFCRPSQPLSRTRPMSLQPRAPAGRGPSSTRGSGSHSARAFRASRLGPPLAPGAIAAGLRPGSDARHDVTSVGDAGPPQRSGLT